MIFKRHLFDKTNRTGKIKRSATAVGLQAHMCMWAKEWRKYSTKWPPRPVPATTTTLPPASKLIGGQLTLFAWRRLSSPHHCLPRTGGGCGWRSGTRSRPPSPDAVIGDAKLRCQVRVHNTVAKKQTPKEHATAGMRRKAFSSGEDRF